MTRLKMIRDITDIRLNDKGDTLVLNTRNFRGDREQHNVLDFSPEEVYSLIIDAYNYGKLEQMHEIKKVLGIRNEHI